MFQRTLLSGIIGAALTLTHGMASASPQDGAPAKKPEANAPDAKAESPRSQAPARHPGSRALLPRAFDEAFRAARAMKDPSDRAEALLTLAWAQVDQSPIAARKTLLEARAAAEAIPPDAVPITSPIRSSGSPRPRPRPAIATPHTRPSRPRSG